MNTVILIGQERDYDACVNLMDSDLCEELCDKMCPCSNQEFIDAYIKAHADKFDGEEFRVD